MSKSDFVFSAIQVDLNNRFANLFKHTRARSMVHFSKVHSQLPLYDAMSSAMERAFVT